MITKQYYSHGKLLLTGEYLVLDGAQALAVPTKKGQSLTVTPRDSKASKEGVIHWKSYEVTGDCWFSCCLEFTSSGLQQVKSEEASDQKIAITLLNILNSARQLNPDFLKERQVYAVRTQLEFDRQWGLGTSSTLINNIAQWAEVDAFALLQQSFGGSGYDIACAQQDCPILYTRLAPTPLVQEVAFDPLFKAHLFFVYRNQKQDSKASIAHYRAQELAQLTQAKEQVNAITWQLLNATSLEVFEQLLEKHETLLSKVLKTPTVKSQLFPDYPGAIKSLGGWGGDFMLVTGGSSAKGYFQDKGYRTVIGYSEMVY